MLAQGFTLMPNLATPNVAGQTYQKSEDAAWVAAESGKLRVGVRLR